MSGAPKKTLVPEVLPMPAIAQRRSRTPRERVQAHLKDLLRYSASAGAALLTATGYACVDPMPSPAVCADAGTMNVSASAKANSGFVFVTIDFDVGSNAYGILSPQPGAPINVEGAKVTAWRHPERQFSAVTEIQVDLHADDGASRIDFDVPLTCTDDLGNTMKLHAHVVVTPPGVDGGASMDAGVAPDGGPEADGGGFPYGALSVSVELIEDAP